MGCDIHVFVEFRDPERGVWSSTSEFRPTPRSYPLFSKLGDVRGYSGNHVSRGLPEDVTPEVKNEYEADMYHSPSWMTVEEFVDAIVQTAEEWQEMYPEMDGEDPYFIRPYTAIVAYAARLSHHRGSSKDKRWDVRIVFFFDN